MNARKFYALPLSLLLSTAIYAMDTQTPEKKEQLVESSHETTTLTLSPSSIIMQKSTPSKEKQATTSSTTSVQSKSLGFWTGTKDWIYGPSTMVAHEIATDTFDKAIPANYRRLYKALETETQVPSQENLKRLKDMLDNCRTKEIGIDDLTVLKLVREYALIMRTGEEEQLKDEAKLALQNADKERTALIAGLRAKFVEVVEKTNAIDKKLTEDLDGIYKKHGETILLGTEVKRLTRMVNKPYSR